MKCISCETEINPKWRHAIDQNICPYCGSRILEEHLKNCLANLRLAIDDMSKYPDQLSDWLLSNCNYIKTDSPDLINYLPKELLKSAYQETSSNDKDDKKQSIIKIKLPNGGEQEVLVEKTQSEAKTQGFFERAEVLQGSGKTSGKAPKAPDEPEAPKSIIEKTQNLRELAQQIKKEAASGITSQSSLASMMEKADPEAVAEFQSLIGSGDIIASSLPEPSTGDDDEIPAVALAMARAASNKNSGGNNIKDLQSLHEMQAKAQGASQRLNSGKGSFNRGG